MGGCLTLGCGEWEVWVSGEGECALLRVVVVWARRSDVCEEGVGEAR